MLKKRWIYIINGFIVFLFMGCTLAWSIFVVPIETTFSWTRDQTSLAFTVNILFFSVGSILTGILSKKFSFSLILKLSAIMMAIGFFLTSFMNAPWHLYLTYGIITGTGIGLGYNCVLSSCPLWVPEKSATVTGILLMGYALSTAVLGPVLNSLISQVGIINTFRVLAVICGVGIFLGSFLLKTPTIKEMEQLPKVDRQKGKQTYNVVTGDMVKKPIFWVYYILTILFAGVGLAVINHVSPILTESLAVATSTAALVVSIGSLSNGVGRLLWGFIYDKLGVIKSLVLITVVFLVSTFGLFFSFSSNNASLFIICDCLMMFGYAGNAVTCPSVIRTLFGHRTFSLNYSVVSTTSIFTSLFPSVVGMLQLSTNGYHVPLLLIALMAIISLITVIIMSRMYKKEYKDLAEN